MEGENQNVCLFCKIANKELESAVIYENEDFVMVLDRDPNILGQCLVISKQHLPTEFDQLPEEIKQKLMKFLDEAIKVLKRGLSVEKVAVVLEGSGVQHLHVKLFPLVGYDETVIMISKLQRVWFDRYLGFITTKQGVTQPMDFLKKLAEEIRKRAGL